MIHAEIELVYESCIREISSAVLRKYILLIRSIKMHCFSYREDIYTFTNLIRNRHELGELCIYSIHILFLLNKSVYTGLP